MPKKAHVEIATLENKLKELEQNLDCMFDVPILTEEKSQTCEGSITEYELLNAIKSMRNKKSPGNDGLTNNFTKYKHLCVKA